MGNKLRIGTNIAYQHRIVVVGCGGMANHWVEYGMKRENAEIVALVDIRLESAIAMSDKHGLSCGTYSDMKQAIIETKATLVFDVTIPASHFEVGTTAMKLGCDVFSEKPLAETLEQCQEMIRVSESTGQMHAVMQNRRYNPNIIALRQMIETGTIGKPGYAGVEFFIGAHFGGFRDAMDNPLLLDMAIHTFDQARKILGADPVSVYCHEFNPLGSWYTGNASAICIFEMSDGSVFTYQGSWCAEGARTSWEGDWRITGERGTALWEGNNPPYAEIVAPGDQEGMFMRDYVRVEAAPPIPGQSYDHPGCLDEMFSALEEGRQAKTDCRDNIRSMAMVFGAIESAKTGSKVKLT
jgi:predicted dehydrogenase